MRFNGTRLGSTCVCVALVMMTSACGVRVNESKPITKTPSPGADTEQCLAKYGEKFGAYFEGRLPFDQIAEMENCTVKALDTFVMYVSGGTNEGYSAEKLRRFLEAFFTDGEKIPPSLMARVMELKRSFLGGDTDVLRYEDIREFQRLVHVSAREAERLWKMMPISRIGLRERDPTYVHETLELLAGAVRNIGRAFSKGSHTYSMDEFRGLLAELEKKAGSGGASESLRFVYDHLDMFGALKQVLLAPPDNAIEAADWSGLFDTIAVAWTTLLRIEYLFDHRLPIDRGPGLVFLHFLAMDLRALSERMMERRPDGTIPFAQIEKFVGSVFGASGLSQEDSDEWRVILMDLTKAIVARLDDPSATGLTRGTIRALWETLVFPIIDTQRYLESLYLPRGQSVVSVDASVYTRGQTRAELTRGRLELARSWQSAHFPVSWFQMTAVQEVIEKSVPYHRGDEYEMWFPWETGLREEPSRHEFSYRTLSLEMAARTLFQFAIKYYSASHADTLLLDEVNNVYIDLGPLGRKVKFFDPRSVDPGKKRGREADLLLLNSFGDGKLTVEEGTEMLLMLVSSKFHGHRVSQKALEVCPIAGPSELAALAEPMPEAALPLIDAGCFLKEYFNLENGLWDHMPGLRSFFERLGSEDRARFKGYLESVARSVDTKYSYIHREDFIARDRLLKEIDSDFEPFYRGLESKFFMAPTTSDRKDWASVKAMVDEFTRASYKADLSLSQRSQFEESLRYLAEISFKREHIWIDRSDIEGFSLIPQYVESVFRRYDRNRDGLLSRVELESVFEVMRFFLENLGIEELKTVDDYRSLFFYLVRNGGPPGDDWYAKPVYATGAWWRQQWGEGDLRADRMRMLQILYLLKTGGKP